MVGIVRTTSGMPWLTASVVKGHQLDSYVVTIVVVVVVVVGDVGSGGYALVAAVEGVGYVGVVMIVVVRRGNCFSCGGDVVLDCDGVGGDIGCGSSYI